MDLLRLSSIHTPSALNSSLGIIGGLVLSDLAVKVGVFVPETVLYIALAAVGTFATPSLEFALAIRIFRLFLLIMTGIIGVWGFALSLLLIIVITFTSRSFKNGKHYTWPLFPFKWKPLAHILFRMPIPKIGTKNDDKKS